MRLPNCLPLLLYAATAIAADPRVVLLWPGGAPGSEGKTGEEAVRVLRHGFPVAGDFAELHQTEIRIHGVVVQCGPFFERGNFGVGDAETALHLRHERVSIVRTGLVGIEVNQLF